MKNLFGSLMLTLTLMVSAMALYINLGNMLRGEPIAALNSIASGLFVLVWAALSVYSITNHGVYSTLIRFYWVMALLGAGFCVVTISGITRTLEYAAYLLLFLLTPLFGLRLYPMTHFMWTGVLSGIAFCFVVLAIIAASRRSYADEEDIPSAERESTYTYISEDTLEAAETEAKTSEAYASEADTADVAEADTAEYTVEMSTPEPVVTLAPDIADVAEAYATDPDTAKADAEENTLRVAVETDAAEAGASELGAKEKGASEADTADALAPAAPEAD